MKIFILFFSFLVFTACAVEYNEIRNLSLDSDGIKNFEIDCGAGFLEIAGADNIDRIEVEAEIIIDTYREDVEYVLNKMMVLYLEKHGSDAILKSMFETSSRFGSGNLAINLKILIPSDLKLIIDDGSGYIKIKGLENNIDIDDGSGDIEIFSSKGNIYIDDGSGTIDIEDVTGNLRIDDGSGTINIYKIDGSVNVDDGSGSINIDGVSKDVTIEDDGSGSVSIRNVDGVVKRYDD